ncbi:SOS response-associated peptidase family protein [Nodularia spumigena CS-584]|nr:SOS response-associated peptidase family protein [Nodularia spumigena CS-584]
MCRNLRPGQNASQLEVEFDARFHRAEALVYKKHFVNGHEHLRVPIICDKAPDKIVMGLWGLIPSWSGNMNYEDFYKKQAQEHRDTLMARIEDVETKVSYRDSLNNRCIILLESFKEWQHVRRVNRLDKISYEISHPESKYMAVAGLYQLTNGKLTFTLLTTEANELMAEIHNSAKRMPVILNKLEAKTWLRGAPKELFYDRSRIQLVAHPENQQPTQNVIYL